MVIQKKIIPFEFILEELRDLNPHTKPMFGAHGVYLGNKIVFILRERLNNVEDNGVWLATTGEHHASLQTEFPSMRSIALFGPGPTGWQILSSDSDDFEESVLRACELVRSNDVRIGKTPKTKMRKKALKKPIKKLRTVSKLKNGKNRTKRKSRLKKI